MKNLILYLVKNAASNLPIQDQQPTLLGNTISPKTTFRIATPRKESFQNLPPSKKNNASAKSRFNQ
jgi:hypothetical protein